MNGLNQINIIGYVTRDAELKTVNVNGVPTACCKFSVAVNERRSNGKEIVTYFDVTTWRERAENIAPWTLKGRKVFVTGSVRLNQYVTNGMQRSAMQIHNATSTLLDNKPNKETPKFEEVDDDDTPFG